jgi:hypothetical protein
MPRLNKPGPKPESGRARVRFKSNPVVSARTRSVLNAWKTIYGKPIGRMIDSMLKFCETNNKFTP